MSAYAYAYALVKTSLYRLDLNKEHNKTRGMMIEIYQAL